MSEGALVRIDDVIAGYFPGVNILNGCDLYAHPASSSGIIGPNGAGKSTLLKSLFGLVQGAQRQGHARRGEDITNLRADKLVSHGHRLRAPDNNVFPS
jgi:branched-chain amino acid transport system ATP-binding protein